jgi:superfamily II DNA or RNA helicase
LKVYNQKAETIQHDHNLQNYCNLSTWYGFQQSFVTKLRTHPYSYATKLSAVADSVLADNKKTLLLLHRKNGLRGLIEIFKHKATKLQYPCNAQCWFALYNKPTNRDKLAIKKFNDETNSTGRGLRVALADAKYYSEGVDFKSIQKIILVDVPPTFAAYEQRIGRVLRSCAHQYQLEPKDRYVVMEMYIAVHPDPTKHTPDQKYFHILQKEHKNIANAMARIRDISVDKYIYPLIQKTNQRNQVSLPSALIDQLHKTPLFSDVPIPAGAIPESHQ